MPRIGVILSGCGVHDGAEIHESVITLLALDRAGADTVCLAPNVDQRRVYDHLAGREADDRRNVLVESARIARGEITDLAAASPAGLDAVIMPGGFGAALNLSSFAVDGAEGAVEETVSSFLRGVHEAGKPIGAICIAPAVVALALGTHRPKLTIGYDAETAAGLEKCGAHHVDCPVDDIVVDEDNRIVSTPAYMLGPGPKDVAAGIEKLVARILAMCT